MVALLTRLQIKLTLRSFSGNTARIVGLVFLGLYVGGMMLAMLAGMFVLRQAGPQWAGPITTLIFAVVTLLWPVLMVLLGSNDALAPARFALFPVRASQLQPGLLVATLFTFGGVVSLVFLLGYLIAWSTSLAIFAVALCAAVLGIGFAMLVTRTLTAGMSATLASRKFRDWVVVIVGLFAMLAAMSGQLFAYASRSSMSGEQLTAWASVAAWSPFGWPWALPWDAAHGDWLAFASRLALTFGCAALLWITWRRFLERALTSPLEASGGTTKVDGHGRIDKLMPAGAVGAIGARTLRYWARDPRRKLQAISMLVMPLVLTVMAVTQRDAIPGPGLLIIPAASMALVGLALVSAEISYDGSAMWEQVVSGTSGRVDRLGRLLGLAWLIVPFAMLLWLGYHLWVGHWHLGFVTLAAMAATIGVSAGLGSWSGAIWCYAMPPSGTGINSRGNLSATVGVLLSMLIEGALLGPVAAAAIASYWVPVMLWVSPLVSLLVGGLTLWLGIHFGGSYLDKNWPEVLKRITWDKP